MYVHLYLVKLNDARYDRSLNLLCFTFRSLQVMYTEIHVQYIYYNSIFYLSYDFNLKYCAFFTRLLWYLL